MTPHEAARGLARVGLFACVFACLLGAFAPARASHVYVEPGNPSAYQTINAATPLLWAYPGWVDTILVAPGVYPETLIVHDNFTSPARIIGTGGPSVTTVYGAAFGFTFGFAAEGFTFRDSIRDARQSNRLEKPPGFKNCVFEQGVHFLASNGREPNIQDCTFLANSELMDYTGYSRSFTGLRFTRCRLRTSSIFGSLAFTDCRFIGPVDTALVTKSSPDNSIYLTGCEFDSADVALACAPQSRPGLFVLNAKFRDCGVGISLNSIASLHWTDEPRFSVKNTTFERVGRGVETRSLFRIGMTGVSFVDCADAAIDAIACRVELSAIHVEHAGRGVVIDARGFIDSGGFRDFQYGYCDDFDFRDIVGDALHIVVAPSAASGRLWVRRGIFSSIGGDGIAVSARGVTIAENLVSGVQGDGIVLQQLAPATQDSIVGNTVAFAAGCGISVARDSGVVASMTLVANNIAVFSGQAGISVGTFATALMQQNDAWQNSLGDFENVSNPLASNLTTNPLFCAVGSGDFTLQAGSPCSPAGIYGLIGARPVACAASPVGVTPRTPLLALSVGPNPSLGAVRFALPSRGEAAELEVLDLAGRRVWSAQVAPNSESLEWNGRVNGARVSGVFFARVTRGGTSSTQRFALLN